MQTENKDINTEKPKSKSLIKTPKASDATANDETTLRNAIAAAVGHTGTYTIELTDDITLTSQVDLPENVNIKIMSTSNYKIYLDTISYDVFHFEIKSNSTLAFDNITITKKILTMKTAGYL